MRKCYSFEPSGHRFLPLDGQEGIIWRLYCTRCGRISLATSENNVANWDTARLPAESKVDMLTNERRTDA